MKKNMMSMTVLMVALSLAAVAEDGRISSLTFQTRIFEGARAASPASFAKSDPDIVWFSKIAEDGIGAKASSQLDNLIFFFNLQGLKLREEGQKIEVEWDQKKTGNVVLVQSVRMGDDTFFISLIPQEVNFDYQKGVFRFSMEIYKNSDKNVTPASLRSLEIVKKKDILWNFHGPLTVGFFAKDKIYFVTFTIWAKKSWQAGTLGGGISWII